jgi:transforming growth factor-beta-induced protein
MKLLASILSVFVSATTLVSAQQNLGEVAAANNLNTLLVAVTATGQDAVLTAPGAFTVFAPTDEAFAALPVGALEYLLVNVDVLSTVLGYHVVPGVVLSTDLMDGMTATTLTQETLEISIVNGTAYVEDAAIVSVDLVATNGVIHIIDSVLIPPGLVPPNIVEIGMADDNFSTLVAAVTEAGLADTLVSDIYTLFAPTNEAFAALPDGALQYLLANTDILADVLMYHVAPGIVLSANVSDGMEIPTLLEGESLLVAVGDNVTVGGATVTDFDTIALNGVIHVIDTVLLPPSLVLPSSIATVISGDDFATLKSALEATGLISALSGAGPFTIFAPSESAFNAFNLASPGTLKTLMDEPDMTTLKEILLYHVVSPELISSVDIADGVVTSAETLQGENVSFTPPMDGMMFGMVDDAKISAADVMILNGIVHVIDSILAPPGVSILPSVFQVANETGQFTTLLTAVKTAGLAESLNSPGPFTVFAPTDDAFAKVQSLESILANTAAVVGLLSYHVVGGVFVAADLVDGMELTTLAGKKVKITLMSNGMVMVNSAMVVQADIMGSNGVVHAIDTLLDPKDAVLAVESTMEPSASPTATATDSPTDGAMMTNTVLAILSSLAVAAGIAVV